MSPHKHAPKPVTDTSVQSVGKVLQTHPFQPDVNTNQQAPQRHEGTEALTGGFDLTKMQYDSSSLPISPLGQPLQAKLTIGEPNDKYEQEADRVAHDVVQRVHAPSSGDNPNSSDSKTNVPYRLLQRDLNRNTQVSSMQASVQPMSGSWDLTKMEFVDGPPRPPTLGPLLQAKLTIGAPNDKYEQEADRVAKQVVQRLSLGGGVRSANGKDRPPQPNQTLQRETDPEENEELQIKLMSLQRSLTRPQPKLHYESAALQETSELAKRTRPDGNWTDSGSRLTPVMFHPNLSGRRPCESPPIAHNEGKGHIQRMMKAGKYQIAAGGKRAVPLKNRDGKKKDTLLVGATVYTDGLGYDTSEKQSQKIKEEYLKDHSWCIETGTERDPKAGLVEDQVMKLKEAENQERPEKKEKSGAEEYKGRVAMLKAVAQFLYKVPKELRVSAYSTASSESGKVDATGLQEVYNKVKGDSAGLVLTAESIGKGTLLRDMIDDCGANEMAIIGDTKANMQTIDWEEKIRDSTSLQAKFQAYFKTKVEIPETKQPEHNSEYLLKESSRLQDM